MFLIAHLSDPHLDGRPETRDRLARVARYLDGLTTAPDAVVVTGDIIQGDHPQGYAVARELLSGAVPVLFCPGNSDDRTAFAASLDPPEHTRPNTTDSPPPDPTGRSTGVGPVHQVRRVGAVTFVLLDSLIPGRFEGELGEDSLRWLKSALASADPGNPVVVGLHHPPIAFGHPGVDPLGLRTPAGFLGVLAEFPNVVAVLAGHTHSATSTLLPGGLPLLVAPGVHSSLILPWEVTHAGPPYIDDTAPPGLAFHLVHDDRRITSYFKSLPA